MTGSRHVEPISRDVLVRGIQMRVYEWPGEKPTLIFLHPSSGFGRMWDFVVGYLGTNFHCIAPDQRGHGNTDKPYSGYAGEDYAADLRALVNSLALRDFILVGHSLGGRVGQIYAGEHPEEVKGLILVAGPHYVSFFQEPALLEENRGRVETMRTSPQGFPSREEALRYLRQNRPGYPEEAYQHILRHNTRQNPEGSVEFLFDKVKVADTLSHIPDDLKPYARKVRCPVLFIRGAKSQAMTRQRAEQCAAYYQNVRIVDIPGEYVLQLENPKDVATAIREFVGSLARVPA